MNPFWKRITMASTGVVGAIIVLLVIAVTLLRHDQSVGLNTEVSLYNFSYSVSATRKTKTLGSGAARQTAHGTFFVVTLRVRNHTDKGGFFRAIPVLVDSQGRESRISHKGQQALRPVRKQGDDFAANIGPRSSHLFEVVYDVPPDIHGARLQITTGLGIADMLVDHFYGTKEIRLP